MARNIFDLSLKYSTEAFYVNDRLLFYSAYHYFGSLHLFPESCSSYVSLGRIPQKKNPVV